MLSSLAAKLVASKSQFIFGDEPTSLDCLVYEHLSALLATKSRISEIITKDYSTLCEYTRHFESYKASIIDQVDDSKDASPRSHQHMGILQEKWLQIKHNFVNAFQRRLNISSAVKPKQMSKEERMFMYKRWASITGALTGMIFYLFYTGIVQASTVLCVH